MAETIVTASAAPSKPLATPGPDPAVLKAAGDSGVSAADLTAAIEAVLASKGATAKAKAKPKEPDWATLTEADAYRRDIYVPVIEHEIPDYMDIKLKDPEYMPVWANRDSRRIGQLLAEGYEYLKKEHLHPSMPVMLPFSSDGLYEYQDVVALRVHKRILLGKRRKAFELSVNQLRNNNRPPRAKEKGKFELAEPVQLDPFMEYYDPVV